jgi:hypothetical protein
MTDRPSPSVPGPPAAAPPAAAGEQWVVAVAPLLAAVLTAVGLGGVGDAPHPHAPSAAIADWFTSRRTEIVHSAPVGHLGAALVVVTVVASARRARRACQASSGSVVVIGGAMVAAYLAACHLAWSAISQELAGTSPEAARSVFVLTTSTSPVLAVGVALMVGGKALSRPRRPLVRRSAAGAVALVAALGTLTLHSSGYWSPDVQQQVAANVLLVWLTLVGLAEVRQLVVSGRSRGRPSSRETSS